MKYTFSNKYLKDNSKPGSYRRGYETYQNGMVEEVKFNENIVRAKVKGNFKSHYETGIKFTKGEARPTCNCPLEEPWCKHAVALGFYSLKNHFWEEFLYEKMNIEPNLIDEDLPMNPDPQGDFIFHFNPKRRQNFFSILVMNRHTKKVIRDLEAVFKQIILKQKEDEDFQLNNSQKLEVLMFKMLLNQSRLDKKSGWYDVQINKFDEFFKMLSKMDDVIDAKTHQKIKFSDSIWNLCLDVNVSYVGNILLSLYWKRNDIDEIYPFEEVRYFSRQLKWGRYKDIIFQTDTSVSVIPQNLTKSSFSDIKDADGGKFVYEELPKLKEVMTVNMSDEMEKLTFEKRPPICVVELGVDYDQSLKASLEFEYDGVRVPYQKQFKSPYVTIKDPSKDLLYWIKRDMEFEQAAYKMLLACRFAPVQSNNLALDKEYAIDFYNYYISKAGEGWKFIEKDDLSFYKLNKKGLKLIADIDFLEDRTDSFGIKLKAQIDETEVDFEKIIDLTYEGAKYYNIPSGGQAPIPVDDVLSLLKSFNTYDVYKNDEETYIVKTYRAGVVTEMEKMGIVLKMSRKFSAFWKEISTFSDMESTPLPKNLKAELREYQLKGYSWLWFLYKYGLNGVLADDMGLGKTVQTLALLQKAKEKDTKKPNLVICPTSVVFNWEKEIEKFTPNLKYLTLTGPNRKDKFKDIDKYDVIITSYALIRRDVEDLKKLEFRYVILDESQNIKNATSQTSHACKSLNSIHRLALSGTPIENRLEELWSIFDFLMPGFLFDPNEFNHRFVLPIVENNDTEVQKRLKTQIFPFILRRMKRDVAKDLPDKIESVAYCELTPDQKDLYLQVLDSTKEELFKSIETVGLEKSRMSIFSALLRLRQICCHPRLYDKEGQLGINESGKFEHLQDMLEEIISEKHRILLFSQFVGMLDIIKDWLEKKGIKHEYLSGKTKDRQAVVERFNEDPTIPIFLVSLKAGGTGLNLTGADYVIHYDPWWNPAVEDQATDRAYRIGQTKKVFVYRLITKGTVEEKIQALKSKKRSLVDSVISIDRNIVKTLTYQDIKDIFSV